MNWRVRHGIHTRFEPQPPEKVITAQVKKLQKLLENWFTGEWGIVKHSCMPQQLDAIGDHPGFIKYAEELKANKSGQITWLSALECNIHRTATETYADGKPNGFDTWIASIHCTPQCGWTSQTPLEFLEAYRAVLPSLARTGGSIGHMMLYAQGAEWTDNYVQVLREAAEVDVVVGIFIPNALRRKPIWTRADIYHPTDGLTIVQPWALLTLRDNPRLRLSLEWDAHEAEDLQGLRKTNLALLSGILSEERVLKHCRV